VTIFKGKGKSWWRDRFVTLMVIPERTRRVHKLVVPFFLLKLGAVLVSLGAVFLIFIGLDYIHVLGRLAENKRLKGENFKLRQEIQLIRNKVDSMETNMERVRNYAKKLQILTGQGDKTEGDLPQGGPGETEGDREPASRLPVPAGRRSSLSPPGESQVGMLENSLTLDDRVEKLQTVSLSTETTLSRLQVYLLAQSALASATPSLLPIAGWLSSAFGYRRNPYDGRYRMHMGIDIAAEPGTPVRAPAPGLVVFAGIREGYGKVVVINHGYGISTVLAHNSKLFVNAGVRVKRGETISEVGSTGHSTGPHLHFEIRKNGVPVNPATFFSRRF
jgi:murein DD-endopeptidase MepM/ murein hydrolase activator NlpD